MHVAMKVAQVTAVADDVEPVATLLVKTQCHGIDGRIHRELARMHHAQGPENILLNVLLEWQSRNALDDVAGKICPVVRVGRNRSGNINLLWLVSDYKSLQRR